MIHCRLTDKTGWISMADAREKLPGNVTKATLIRWAAKGKLAMDKRTRVYLPARKIGDRWFTTVRALEAFLEEISRPVPADWTPPAAGPDGTAPIAGKELEPMVRRPGHAAAVKELQEQGLM